MDDQEVFELFGGKKSVLEKISDLVRRGIEGKSVKELKYFESISSLPAHSLYAFANCIPIEGRAPNLDYNSIKNLFRCLGLEGSSFLGQPSFSSPSSRQYWEEQLISLMVQGPAGISLESACRIRATGLLTIENPVLL